MGLLSLFIPKEKRFFDMIQDQSANVVKGVDALVDMIEHYDQRMQKKSIINDIEHDGDKMVHNILEELNKTFITPIDREDISGLVSSLDDILDYVEGTAECLVLYKIENVPNYLPDFAKVLQHAVRDLHQAIVLLRDFKEAVQIRKYCEEVYNHENEGDALMRKALAELFENQDIKYIIKMKEIYYDMETAIDRAEDVANVLGDILVKYT